MRRTVLRAEVALKTLQSVVLLSLSVLLLGGCEALKKPDPVAPAPPPQPVRPQSALIAEQAIFSGSSVNNTHLANLEVWMDGSPRHPRIVLSAVTDLEFFDLSLALPSCYTFFRPNGEIPSWRGTQLAAGERVEIASRWEQISDRCGSDYATVLWNMASQYQGSKSKLSVVWAWPDGAASR